jgi:hypothetical protein
MSIWTVKPEEVKVDLVYKDQPFWITVKKFLTVGEERRIMTAGWRGMASSKDPNANEEITIDWKLQTFARTETYLLDWSLTDDKAVKLPVNRAVIETLEPDLYGLIEQAITGVVEASAEEKKLKAGSAAPSPTSVS